jgi:hypothetical protein
LLTGLQYPDFQISRVSRHLEPGAKATARSGGGRPAGNPGPLTQSAILRHRPPYEPPKSRCHR